MGFENLITYDEYLDGYYATAVYEESEHMRYIEEFEDDDDVQSVYHNVNVGDELAAAMD